MRKRRKDQKTNKTRPRKAGAAKNRRRLEQKRRLIALGVEEETVNKMNSRDILTMLKYPAKIGKES